MTRPAVRVVQPGEAASVEMHEAIAALARLCIAAQPVAVLLAWEEVGGKVTCKTLPDSKTLLMGIVDSLFDHVHPPESVE